MSFFYQQCQRVCAECKDRSFIFFDISDNNLFHNAAEKLSVETVYYFDKKFPHDIQKRIQELRDSGFHVTEDKECIRISCISAIFGFALECRLAFEQAEQAIIDKAFKDLPEISEFDFLKKAYNGECAILIPFYTPYLTERIQQNLHEKYKFWTDQGFRLYIHESEIELFFDVDE